MRFSKTDFHFLDASRLKAVIHALTDLNHCIDGTWALTGSISYRMQLPDIQTQLGLRDIDIRIYPKTGGDRKLIVTKNIKKAFYVIEIDHVRGGYYFRLIHKATKIPVDLFTHINQTEFEQVMLGNLLVNLVDPEENMYAMLLNLAKRATQREAISQKWIDHAHIMWQVINQEHVLLLMSKYRKELEPFLPTNFDFYSTGDVEKLLFNIQATDDKWTYSYPDNSITTLNGIGIEDEKTHRHVMNMGRESQRRRLYYKLKDNFVSFLK